MPGFAGLLPGLTAAGDPQALQARAREHYEAGRYLEAVESFRGALEQAPADEERARLTALLARSLGAHGAELLGAGENRRAEDAFRQALKHHSDFYAHFGLGFLELTRQKDEAAREHLRQALVLEPDYAQAYRFLAVLDYRRGDTERAIERLDRALGLVPEDLATKDLRERWRNLAVYARSFQEKRRGLIHLRFDPQIDATRVLEVMELLEEVVAEISATLRVEATRPLLVVLLRQEDFHGATGSHGWVGGLYDGQLQVPLPEADAPDRKSILRRTLRHEVAHFFVQILAPSCPSWLNEGLAQYLERAGDDEKVRVRRALRSDPSRRLPFAKIPARLGQVEDIEVARWSYLQALGFVHHLVEEHHEFRLWLLLEALSREGSVAGAFEWTYGATLPELEARWWGAWLGATPVSETGATEPRSR